MLNSQKLFFQRAAVIAVIALLAERNIVASVATGLIISALWDFIARMLSQPLEGAAPQGAKPADKDTLINHTELIVGELRACGAITQASADDVFTGIRKLRSGQCS